MQQLKDNGKRLEAIFARLWKDVKNYCLAEPSF